MLVIYGAGSNFIKFVQKYGNAAIPETERILMDSYPEKYPDKVLGYQVYGTEKLKEMSSNDYVYITSEIYHDEIERNIKRTNSDIKICNYAVAAWLWCNKKGMIQRYSQKEDSCIFEIDVEEWLKSALTYEMNHWNQRIPWYKENDNERFTERNFMYKISPELVFTETDIKYGVGCGPLPVYGNIINGRKIQYLPVDPLAYQYKELLRKNHIILPVEPKFAIMEFLTGFYKSNTADYIIVHNALDHCVDILRAFIECFCVLKTGGCLLMAHMEAEGVYEDYVGLHQWNIAEAGGDLLFFNKDIFKINVSKMFAPYADIELKRIECGVRDIICAKICKKQNLPQEMLDKFADKTFAGKIIDRLFAELTNITKV